MHSCFNCFLNAGWRQVNERNPCPVITSWREAGLRYYAYGFHLREAIRLRRVQKVSLDAGLTCPNVDGTVAVGGCVFCDNRSFSPSRRIPSRCYTQRS